MKTLKSMSNIRFLIFIILVGCMWTSLGEKQAANKTPKKNCVSPCRIFHRWCKNEGKCREKGLDCTWYCECPKNCTGFFCEKIIPLDELGSNGQKVVVKVTYEREKKKDVTAFDKSKLAQALAGIMKVKQTDEEQKIVLPETIERIGKTINIKENVTANVTIICQPGELASNYQKNLSTLSNIQSVTTNVTQKQNNSETNGIVLSLKNNTTNVENSPITITRAMSLAATPTTVSPIVKSSFAVASTTIDTKPIAKGQTVTNLQESTGTTQTTDSTKTEVKTSITPSVAPDVSAIKLSVKQNLTTIENLTEGLLIRTAMPPPPAENSLYRKETNELKTENKPTLLDIIEKSIAVEHIATQTPEYRKTLTTAFVPVDKHKTTTEIKVNISTAKITESHHQPTGVTESSHRQAGVTESHHRPTGVTESHHQPTGVTASHHQPTGVTESHHQPTGVTESHHQPTGVTESHHQPTGVTESTIQFTEVTESTHQPTGVTESSHRPTGVTESYHEHTTGGTSSQILIDLTTRSSTQSYSENGEVNKQANSHHIATMEPTTILDHGNNNTVSVAAERITVTTMTSIQSKNMTATYMQVSAESSKMKLPITHNETNNVNTSVLTIIDRSSNKNSPNTTDSSTLSTTADEVSTKASTVKYSMQPARRIELSNNNKTAKESAETSSTTKHASLIGNVLEEANINRALTPSTLPRNELVTSYQMTSKSVTDTPESSIHGQKEVTRDSTTSIPKHSFKANKVNTTTESSLNKISEIGTTKTASTTVQSINSKQDFNDHQSKQTPTVQTSTNLSSDKKIVTGDINIRSPTSIPSLNVTAVTITSHDVPSASEKGMSTSHTSVPTVSTTDERTDATTSPIAVKQSKIHGKIKKVLHTTPSQVMYSSTPATVKSRSIQSSTSTSSSNWKQLNTSTQSFPTAATEKYSTQTTISANASKTVSRKAGKENNRKSTIDSSNSTTHGSVLAKISDYVDGNENGQNMTTGNSSIKKQTFPKHTTTYVPTATQSQTHDKTKTASESITSELNDPSTLATQAIKTANTHSDNSLAISIDKSTSTPSEGNNLNTAVSSTQSTKANSHDNFETSTIVNYKINSTKTSTIRTLQATTDLNTNGGHHKDTAASNIVPDTSSQISEYKTLQKPKKDNKVAHSINAMTSANERRISPSSSSVHMHDLSDSKLVLTKDFLDRKSDMLSASKDKNELLTKTLNESVKDLKFDLHKMKLRETGHPSDIDNIL